MDPYCDPGNPTRINFEDIVEASLRLNGSVRRTTCTRSDKLTQLLDITTFLKNECQQVTKSFKERGARNALLGLTKRQQRNGVISASSGNHAIGIAYHGRQLGIPVTVVMPITAPMTKIERCRDLDAVVLVQGANVSESKAFALDIAHTSNLTYINGFDHPDVLAGQGTVALEILEQVHDIDAILVPVGGGGLIAGTAVAVKSLCPHVAVIGVEAESNPSYQRSLLAGRPVRTGCGKSIADGILVPLVGSNSLANTAGLIDKMVTVKEAEIERAIALLYHFEKAIVEGAGAVSLAALLGDQLPELVGKRVVCVLSGGNMDVNAHKEALRRAAMSGLVRD